MLSPETGSILLSLCATEPPSLEAASLKGIDTTQLVRLANRHGVMPLVSRALGGIASQVGLQFARQDAAKRALAFSGELVRILDLLGNAGIPVLPLRGPVLADLLYGDIAARDCSDLDLLVRRQDVIRVTELLAGSYVLQPPGLVHRQCTLRWGFELSLRRRPHGPVIDVHWDLGPRYYPFALPAASLWNDLRTISFQQRPAPFLPPESLLLTLCIHGAKHHWERLVWVCDVARLVSKSGLDWDQVIVKAAAWRCRPPLLLGLALAHDLLGASLPAALLEPARRSESIQALARQVRERMLSSGDPGPYSALESCSFHFRLAGFRRGLRYALGILLVPTDADWSWIALPRSFHWLYYALRQIRFAWKYASALLKRVSRQPAV